MPRYRVIRESTRSNPRDQFAETGWWILDPGGRLMFASPLDALAQDRANWLQTVTAENTHEEIFDYLDSYGGDAYFRLLSLPEWRDADDLPSLLDSLKRAITKGATQ